MNLQKADAAISEEVRSKIREGMLPIITGCASEQQIPMDKIKEFKEKEVTPTVDDANACFFACIFKKTEMIDEKGMFSEEKAIEKSSKFLDGTEELDKVKEAAKNCNSVNEETVSDGEKGCDRAKLLFNCIKEQADKFGFGLPA
uniref:Odorant binding protein 1 n=1 Tax=Argyresthia conjugella TaxID=687015 RepID=H9N4R8_9NEOP|nr:odorant binding protein 1 [Argyresthia conjugella]